MRGAGPRGKGGGATLPWPGPEAPGARRKQGSVLIYEQSLEAWFTGAKIRSGLSYALGNLVFRLVKLLFIYFLGKTFKLLAFYVLVKPRRALTELVDRFRKALHTLWKFKGK